MSATEIDKAIATLSRVDKTFRRHIEQVGPCPLRPRMSGRSHFEQLARNIAYQQLAGKAAATIWGRVRELIDGRFEPEKVLALTDAQLRSAGLSNAKMLSIQDLAQQVADGRLSLARIGRHDDETVIEELTRVRGIGRWTAEMFLMFQLGRLDVWPVGDLGVRNGYRQLYKLGELPSVAELAEHGNKFAPYRSVAAWYLWRAVDVVLPVASGT